MGDTMVYHPQMTEYSFEDKKKLVMREIAGEPVATLAREFGVSRNTTYEWLKAYGREGDDGLKPKSKRPLNSPNKTSDEMKQRVVRLKQENEFWSANKVSVELSKLGYKLTPKTVRRIFAEHGLNYKIRKDGEHIIKSLPAAFVKD